MKIVIIGGTGLIGSKTAERLRKKGHEVIAASPNTSQRLERHAARASRRVPSGRCSEFTFAHRRFLEPIDAGRLPAQQG